MEATANNSKQEQSADALLKKVMPRRMEAVQAECQECGDLIRYFPLKIAGMTEQQLTPTRCEKCTMLFEPKVVPKDEGVRLAELHERKWEKICDWDYRIEEEGGNTRMKDLPMDKVREVMNWKSSSRKGLVLHGDTGLCKTRIIYRLLRRLHDEGKKIRTFDGTSFGLECSNAFRNGTEMQWLDTIYNADVVLFDDLWKHSPTDRVDAEFFGVIEKLGRKGIPYFITTNFISDKVMEEVNRHNGKMSLDRAIAILRRIREQCIAVEFVKKDEQST